MKERWRLTVNEAIQQALNNGLTVLVYAELIAASEPSLPILISSIPRDFHLDIPSEKRAAFFSPSDLDPN